LRISDLENRRGKAIKHVSVITLRNGDELLVHYGTPIAGIVDRVYVKTDAFPSVTSSSHIDTYLYGRPAAVVEQSLLDSLLSAV